LEVEEILGRYWASGKTQRVFTEEEGIGVSTLQYWLRQIGSQHGRSARRRKARKRSGEKAASAPLSLLEVELERAGRPSPGGTYEIELPGGTHLRFGVGFAEVELRRLLALLREEH